MRSGSRSPFDIVAMTASAGGLHALGQILSQLPTDFPVPILIVQHLDPRHCSLMAQILSRNCNLMVKEAEDGEAIEAGTVYVAPPNRHLLVNERGHVELTDSELVHFLRPSGDLLFESVAAIHKDRAIAIVLTGTGKDGSRGVEAIKKMGGKVIVEDPSTAEFAGMPNASIATRVCDLILPLKEISSALILLATLKVDPS